MADVGKAASVSAQTVSRYFTGGYVGSDTRERIQTAIADLGYRHNRVARNLRVNRTDTIGLLLMGPVNYGNSSILTGISTAARKAGISLVTTQLDIDTTEPSGLSEVRHAIDNFLSFQVDGIITGSPYLGTENVLDYIGETVPVVSLAGLPPENLDVVHADSVSADSYGAGLMATRHLIELGHRRILHLAGPGRRIEAMRRTEGYLDALAEAGLEPLDVLECQEWDAEAAAVHGRVVDVDTFTAVFAANDLIALGFIGTMAERGYSAPGDFSIIGVDDMPEVAYYSPALTSLRIDFTEVGAEALRVILAHIATNQTQPHVVIRPSLSARASTRQLRVEQA